jgi:hypothetical protein
MSLAILLRPVESSRGRASLALLAGVGGLVAYGTGSAAVLVALAGLTLFVAVTVCAAVHRAIGGGPRYPFGPARAVFYTLAPVTNLLWVVWWPAIVVGWWAGPSLVVALALDAVGLHGLAALAWLGLCHLALRRPAREISQTDARTVVLFDCLWLIWVVASVITPPDVITTILLIGMALPFGAVGAWVAMGLTRWERGRARALTAAVLVVSVVAVHAVAGRVLATGDGDALLPAPGGLGAPTAGSPAVGPSSPVQVTTQTGAMDAGSMDAGSNDAGSNDADGAVEAVEPLSAQACQDDTACGPWERCLFGVCTDGRRDCTLDADCGADARCEFSTCVGGDRECRDEGDCGGEACVFGRCGVRAADCSTDPDCGAGRFCMLGVCTEGVPNCQRDADCAATERCLFRQCQAGQRECDVDSDCAEDARCELGTCADGPRECRRDDECGRDARCEFGACADGPRECHQNADCGDERVCEFGRCADPG